MPGGSVAALIHDHAGTWFPVFVLASGLDGITAPLALFVLKGMRRAWAVAAVG